MPVVISHQIVAQEKSMDGVAREFHLGARQ
jgi:hypothetical protein